MKSLDIRNGYFQGRKLERDVWIRPPPEVGLAPGSLVKADVGVYGFTDGARRFWEAVSEAFLNGLGCIASLVESAFFYIKDAAGKLIGLFLVHVDDILCTYCDCPQMRKLMDKLQNIFKFGKINDVNDGFVYCGRHYQRDATGTIKIGMKAYADNLQTFPMTRQRRQEEESSLLPFEVSALRGLGGQIQWLGRQGHPRIGFRASRLASCYTNPKVKDLKEANSIIKAAKKVGSDTIQFKPNLEMETAIVIGVQDASFDNLKDNGSQAGKLLLLADPAILDGTDTLRNIATMEWSSNRIKRVVRATLAAEAYSAGESGEGIEYLRYFLAELFEPDWTVAGRDEIAERRTAALVTDARSLYDSLMKDNSSVKDRRLRLEMSILKGIRNIVFKWVRSEQMIADELTKEVPEEVHDYARMVRQSGVWTFGNDARAPISRRNRALSIPKASEPEEEPEVLAFTTSQSCATNVIQGYEFPNYPRINKGVRKDMKVPRLRRGPLRPSRCSEWTR
jgi:hypothetical protein